MKQGTVLGRLVLAIVLCLTGCGSSGPSLTGAELAAKHPDKKYVQINGVSLHYEQEGLGRPLVLLHGLLGYSFSWRFAMPALAQQAKVYAVDMPGAGFSERAR